MSWVPTTIIIKPRLQETSCLSRFAWTRNHVNIVSFLKTLSVFWLIGALLKSSTVLDSNLSGNGGRILDNQSWRRVSARREFALVLYIKPKRWQNSWSFGLSAYLSSHSARATWTHYGIPGWTESERCWQYMAWSSTLRNDRRRNGETTWP